MALKKKILITGTAGFIGGRLLDILSKKYPRSKFISIDRKPLPVNLQRKNVTHIQADINDLKPIFMDIDIVVHLAALPTVRGSDSQIENIISDNILATQNIINECITKWKPKRLIITSSSSVYNGTLEHKLNENETLRPLSPYAVSKITNELTVNMYKNNGKLDDIETIIIRPFTVYGPNQRDELCIQAVIDAFVHDTQFTLYGDGDVRRDFTYIDDTCAAIEELMFCEELHYSTYNIGTGDNISINEMIGKVGRIFEKPLNIKYEPATIYDTNFTKADITRIQRDTNWRPEMSFDMGLMKQIEFQLVHK